MDISQKKIILQNKYSGSSKLIPFSVLMSSANSCFGYEQANLLRYIGGCFFIHREEPF